MSTRHIARSLVLQTLFEIDQRCAFDISQAEALLVLKRISLEFGEDIKDISFAEILVKECLSRRITLDDIIVRAAPDWPLDKIGEVDRNILRLGLCELLFGDRSQVPPKVAIDEAIELAKTFGGETSGRFINGVLGAIYKEMGEPGKEQITKKVEKDSMKHERLVGAVVISNHEGKRYVGLVHDVFGYWTLTKGKIEGEEAIDILAIKKIKSEIGVDVTLTTILGENEYIANKPDEGKVVKHVTYYLAESVHTPLVLEKKGGLDDAKWFPEHEVKDLRMYDDIKPLITKALDYKTVSSGQ
ncbi:MAG: transcription antitermination factor NusB [Candidatus Nomurabacteria bacterium]|nr:transcription antitermination factor NusB [Candidatus Nomurabacteria bacterium]